MSTKYPMKLRHDKGYLIVPTMTSSHAVSVDFSDGRKDVSVVTATGFQGKAPVLHNEEVKTEALLTMALILSEIEPLTPEE